MSEFVLKTDELIFAELSMDELMDINGGFNFGEFMSGLGTAAGGVAAVMTGTPVGIIAGGVMCFAGGAMMGHSFSC